MDKTETIKKLLEGNQKYLTSEKGAGDISPRIRLKTAGEGQNPYAIIITCSDSRVIPEAIFQCGIGDLFVISLAGNVIDNHQLGSIEYAADHLGTKLIMVLGHTHCGAVDAAIHHDPAGYIKFITDEIQSAIGDVKDSYKACCLNVKRSIDLIESSLVIRKDEEEGLAVIGAMYDIETGKVEILP
jgi:carbonic anhydrase